MNDKGQIARLRTELTRMQKEHTRLKERSLEIAQQINLAGTKMVVWSVGGKDRELQIANADAQLFTELWHLAKQRQRLHWNMLYITSRLSRLNCGHSRIS